MSWAPPLPPGRFLKLPGRGTTFIREMAGPPGAPVLFLLHGWTASADLNWLTSFGPLAQEFRVVAIDHRGHGRGIRSRRRFRLADCADDVVAVADELGIESFVPVGYSMGGPISLLTWYRHQERVDGLVLCATSPMFGERPGEKAMFSMLPLIRASSSLSPSKLRRRIAYSLLSNRADGSPVGDWVAREIGRSDANKVLEAGISLGRFDARRWLGEIDVPTAVVRTTLDQAVPPGHQTLLVDGIPNAKVFDVDGNHACILTAAPAFVAGLLGACRQVTRPTEPAATGSATRY